MEKIIEVTGLKKRYDGFDALKGISFHVERGEIFTMVGPNGAGKTTTVEIIEGVRSFDEGNVSIMGKKIGAALVRENIGVQCQRSLSLHLLS